MPPFSLSSSCSSQHPRFELVDNLRANVKDLNTGVLEGNLLNVNKNYHKRVQKAASTFFSGTSEDTMAGMRSLFHLVYARQDDGKDGPEFLYVLDEDDEMDDDEEF